MENQQSNLLKDVGLAFIGCGVMGESIVAGLLRQKLVEARQIVASHPRATRRQEIWNRSF
jgi:pyrroline-5-carboxylate reductase